jgi:hypothetical protein
MLLLVVRSLRGYESWSWDDTNSRFLLNLGYLGANGIEGFWLVGVGISGGGSSSEFLYAIHD